jgi:hypothetical protein
MVEVFYTGSIFCALITVYLIQIPLLQVKEEQLQVMQQG